MSEFRRHVMANIPKYEGLTFTALVDNSVVRLLASGTRYHAYYCVDAEWRNEANWTEVTGNSTELTVPLGNNVYFKSRVIDNPEQPSALPMDSVADALTIWFRQSQTSEYATNSRFAVKGKISSICENGINGNNISMYPYLLRKIFYNFTGLYDASELILDVEGMSGTKWGTYSYLDSMMFSGCSNLKYPPEIPNITCKQGDKLRLFENTAIEEIVIRTTRAQTLSFNQTFQLCKKLKKIVSYINSGYSNSFTNWLNGASSTGDFYNLGGYTFRTGVSGIPSGWTVHTQIE